VPCNALFIIEQQTARSRAPSGVADESSVFMIVNQWVGGTDDLAAREQADLASLRALPEVADATLSPSQPLGGRGMGENITIHPDRPRSGALTAVFLVDDHALNTLGLKLIAGRNFRPDDVQIAHGLNDNYASWGSVIVTRDLARMLEPNGNVLGRVATLRPGNTTATIARQSTWQVRVKQDGKGSRGIWIMPLMIVAGKGYVES